MKLTIFGATGRTGRHLVDQALAQGHDVTVLVRNPDKLGDGRERLRVVTGDVCDAGQIDLAIAGSEAVLSVLGPMANTPDFAVSQGMDNILAAMKTHAVRRLVVSAGAGVRDPKDKPTPIHAFFGTLVKLLSRYAYEDMLRVVNTVRASDTDWAIVRVPRLTDATKTGRIRRGYVGNEVGTQLSRADFAGFMLSVVGEKTFIRQAPAISN